MTLQKIQSDLKETFKTGDELKRSVLRMLISAIYNKQIEKRTREKTGRDVELTEEELLGVISSEAKKRKDASEQFEKGGRPELAAKEKSELDMLMAYLPAQMSEEELRAKVKEAIAKSGAKSEKDFGKVMAALMRETKGRAEGGAVSKIVKEEMAKLG
ncbi:hypothetical protein A2W39_03390 [Candidatus Azambacteria bacterium RIFCSPHIGHO2_01_46_10]|uniref:Glutamyl-tRNA amidotransferase n=4 Tax=Candidatus Azamiibacteriota TaxID=1752741 RepID=A0A1F5C6U1_9BACT|nr:MAG: hypothetical protein A2W39_03390 [Candidatus Azambacteria bacterium RIFCSPHIGHO2_01_46_10]OGD38572.1 MAG: hypothetical protein A3A25_00065 [Candidatus Azambacteria bacterium RIFCSPLOWO2_01_FULL_46_26]OGD44680.1 MAG: hypothetical protein A3J02_00060 [Candidatus Azambacteria bacterium RIFCSPLOWO2_02_FULL_46_11]